MFAYEYGDHADRVWSSSVLSSPHRASLRWRRMGASAPSGACITMMGQSQALHAAYMTTYIETCIQPMGGTTAFWRCGLPFGEGLRILVGMHE